MKYIRDIHAERSNGARPVISFEFFPPKTAEGDRSLLEKTVPSLAPLKPDFCSVTYGAGGSTRDKTIAICDRIQRQHGLVAMCHLTCVNATKEEIGSVLDRARALGLRNILALRGDPPAGTGEFRKVEGGFEFSRELVAYAKAWNCFSIGVAGFPEGHLTCTEGKYVDWDRLRMKVEAGADFVITQLFFDNADYFEFASHLRDRLGVKVPVCPGILPILSGGQAKRFTQLCGARLPKELTARLDELGDDDEAVTEYGIEYATRQVEGLLSAKVPGLHFYTLNKSRSTTRIMKNLGLA